MYEEKKNFDWMSLLLGILFMLTALVTFRNPGTSLTAIVIYLAITAIINGAASLLIRRKVKQLTGLKFTMFLVLGIIEIIVGIVLMFNLNAGILALAYVFAIWFVIDSIRNLIVLNEISGDRKAYYWFSLIVNVLGIFVGFSLFFDPIVSMLTLSFLVGFYLLLLGIFYFVHAFSN
ncbi:DUF308 domain-containing protein [Enterococcus saccharolyticus]|uniref:Acid-resistance membrane protein n=1 Tax=Candidatus Enterococcus willemsii TaxID=1857215 RepID=A0ABQ6YY00_9ENTE|nr:MULTISPECIES: DUF308 domain-containing protein [Enterococcus]KAF1302904.1 hypothetical protein BAU17_11865 [Enterococcus sp. CU12B]MCD5000946.1 DUF308 domain-containing protein [Enterococcus saccharolyticus]